MSIQQSLTIIPAWNKIHPLVQSDSITCPKRHYILPWMNQYLKVEYLLKPITRLGVFNFLKNLIRITRFLCPLHRIKKQPYCDERLLWSF